MAYSQSYTRHDVVRWLGAREVQKAGPYMRQVGRMTIGADRISAQVQGTLREPYLVDVEFHADAAGRPAIAAGCSCPVGFGCKHVAAVLLAVLENREKAAQVNPAVLSWVESFRVSMAPEAKKGKSSKPAERLFYVLGKASYSDAFSIFLLKGRPGADGGPLSGAAEWSNVERALQQPPRFVDEDDLAILRLLWMQRGARGYHAAFPLAGRQEAEILGLLLAGGRLYYQGRADGYRHLRGAFVALREGAPRPAALEWRANERGEMAPAVVARPPVEVLRMQRGLYYVDEDEGLIGGLELPYPAELAARLLTLPPLREPDIPLVSAVLRELAPVLPAPAPVQLRVVDCAPVPVLSLKTSLPTWMSDFRGYRFGTYALDYARPSFRYGEFAVEPGDGGEFRTDARGETVRIKRDRAAEQRALQHLGAIGLAKPPVHVLSYSQIPRDSYLLENEAQWPDFVTHAVPRLRVAGWEVAVPADFRHLLLEVSSWEADLSEEGSGWFSLGLGIVVDGHNIPLAPLLHELFRRDGRWLDPAELKRMEDAEPIFLALPEGGRVRVSAARLKPLARTLVDLFDAPSEGTLRVSRFDAPRLDELASASGWRFDGAEKVRKLASQIGRAEGVAAVAPPAGLALQLRPYQLEGLAWLQHLCRHELGGILADDMGRARPLRSR